MADDVQRSGAHRISVRLPPENPCRAQNFVIAANSSADTENYIIYHFDSQFYRQAQCYSVYKGGAKHAEKFPCK